MKVMVMVKASRGSEAGEMPSRQLLEAMGKFNEELVNAGIMLAGEGLHPSSKGVRVHFSGDRRTVVDGPFMETKELVAGFWLWKVGSMQEAIEWVKRCPNPMMEDSDIEIRPLFEIEDFGEAVTPELREHEAALRAQTLGLGKPRFENHAAMLVAGLNEHYTMQTRGNIPLQWKRFVPHFGNLKAQLGRDAYGICWNNQSDCSFDYLTAVAVNGRDKLPEEFSQLELASQRYAVFTHNGHVSALSQTLDAIWNQWVPECGLNIAQAPCMERYTENFDAASGTGGMEICVPIVA